MWWNKKKEAVQPPEIPPLNTLTIKLVKEVKLSKNGTETTYWTEVNNSLVSNSMSYNQKTAEIFFDRVVKLQGQTSNIYTLKETQV